MIKYEEHFGINILSTKLNSSNKIDFLTKSIVDDVEKFHTSKLGVKSIFVKDESYRYGLNAFKALGGLYAIFRVVCNKLNLDHTSTTFEDLQKADM